MIEWVRPAACSDDSLARYIVDMLITDKSCTQDDHHIHYQTTKFNTNSPPHTPPKKKKSYKFQAQILSSSHLQNDP